MSELFPIIRRVRRPFLVADAPPVSVGNVEPVRVNAPSEKGGLQGVAGGTAVAQVEPNDAKRAAKRSER